MRYTYGSEKVLPLSKKHLNMLEYILVSQPKYSTRGDALSLLILIHVETFIRDTLDITYILLTIKNKQ
jgi:hypothetical protein